MFKKSVVLVVALFGIFVSMNVLADAAGLTTEIATQFKAYIILAIQLISAAAFLIVGYGVIMKFASAVSGRAEWGEVILPVVFGAAILIVSAFMFTEATTAANAISGASLTIESSTSFA